MCRLECVDICIYVYIYIWLSLSSSQFTLCFLCEEFVSWLKWEHFYFIFWNGEVLEIQREGKVVTFSMYFETLKDVQRLVNYSHCWGEESWEGHYCKYIYIYIYTHKRRCKNTTIPAALAREFSKQTFFVVFCSTKLNFF
jgi:hypothetical protein